MKQVKTINALDQQAKALANINPVSTESNIKLGERSKELWVEYAKTYKVEQNCKGLLVDSLYADGIRSCHIVGAQDDDKSLVQLRHQIIQMIVGADPEDKKLFNAEPSSLSLSMQAVQTTLKTKTIPTIIGNIKKALATREANKDKTGKKKPATKEQMAYKAIKDFIKYAKESKGWEGMTKDIQLAESFSVLKQIKPQAK